MCQALGVAGQSKYEADGGPGLIAILDLLLRSETPSQDRSTMFRAAIVFWLLGAIDGHAKNFSIFLRAGGRCQLTPIYDVLSAYPITVSGERHPRELTMAMSVSGTKRRDYHHHKIRSRHWIATAKSARLPDGEAEAILRDCQARSQRVIEDCRAQLPTDFPMHVAEAIFAGVQTTVRSIASEPES